MTCELALGGLLCDVGKVRLPPALPGKTAPLTAADVAQLRSHVEERVRIAERAEGITPRIVEMVMGRHERHDGSGCPPRWARPRSGRTGRTSRCR